jgi:hypothetical protein
VLFLLLRVSIQSARLRFVDYSTAHCAASPTADVVSVHGFCARLRSVYRTFYHSLSHIRPPQTPVVTLAAMEWSLLADVDRTPTDKVGQEDRRHLRVPKGLPGVPIE